VKGCSLNQPDSKNLSLIKLEILCDLYLFLNGYVPFLIAPNRHLKNVISELNQSPRETKLATDSYDDENEEDDDDDDDEEEHDDEDDAENGDEDGEKDEIDSSSMSGEAKSSDLESGTNSQEFSAPNWVGTNPFWSHPSEVTEKVVHSSGSAVDGDDSSVGDSGPIRPKRFPTSDSIDSFRISKEDNISKLTSNRSSLSITSHVNDSATITSSSNSPFSSIFEEIL
jgi:hypothetical protein